MKKKKSIYKKVVIKVGTKIITSDSAALDKKEIQNLTNQILLLLNDNVEVILVSSGAIAGGMNLLGLTTRPKSLPLLQASAAVGQSRLMNIYDYYFQKGGFFTAQLLITQADLSDRARYLNAKNTIVSLLKKRVVPIINENDTVATDEIKFGDNDALSALVANLTGADCLIILTDVDGLYSTGVDGKKSKVDEVKRINHNIEKLVYSSNHCLSVGGMKTKLKAARVATSSGISCVIANGRMEDVLVKVVNGDSVGTLFLPQPLKLKDRKRWIAFGRKPKGRIAVDKGAVSALRDQGRSLLSAGISDAAGDFSYGDVVSVLNEERKEFARGLTNYSLKEIKQIQGCRTNMIEKRLGYKYYDEIIHRDNLVILPR
ncbi:MAG: glutamate 5-kinase [Candidatus Omnitrophica bacterium]|nr:glutamate 5-kinase [Candidatus Omnitrophota bacterium]